MISGVCIKILDGPHAGQWVEAGAVPEGKIERAVFPAAALRLIPEDRADDRIDFTLAGYILTHTDTHYGSTLVRDVIGTDYYSGRLRLSHYKTLRPVIVRSMWYALDPRT